MSDQPEYQGIDEAVDYLMDKHSGTNDGTTGEEHDELEAEDKSEETPEPDTDDEDDVTDSDESEDEDSDEEEPGSDEEEEEGPDVVFTFKDEESGEEVKVTAEEARAGYLRQKDYTRKTQALSEERKQVDSLQQELHAYKGQIKGVLEQLEMASDAELSEFVGIDWKKLEQDDPYEYEEKARRFDALKRQREQAKEHKQKLAQELYAEYEEKLAEFRKEEEQKLVSLAPEFDPEKGGEEYLGKLKSHAETYGFTEDELKGVLDHRALLIMRDAFRYQELKSKVDKGKETVKKVSKSVKPSGRRDPKAAKSQRYEQLRKKAQSTGSIDDALDFLMSRRG